ncbi:GTP cyclohydrolase I type 1 [Planomonospora sphaerica]|uniref:GTP cyclohydrolase 1 n=1 Tax=Planomonospora sphaerica TaxID=161355 RepID=A0A161LJ34_9ACTN|nr:GTP cyclohydrolase I [Planomonospora sphaerica]GAT68864.1 GTP cyclohydrolase I type 1 [Planomonospora sphaerica]
MSVNGIHPPPPADPAEHADPAGALPAPLTPPRPPVDLAAVEAHTRHLLVLLGEDPDREGLQETPRRVAAWWREFLDYDPGRIATVFGHEARGEQYVLVRGLTAWSLCEHHLLPFRVEAAVAVIPHGQVLGLSKLGRILQLHAHRLQLQERLTSQVAATVAEVCGSADVGVWMTGEHLCMSMRGVRDDGARTDTLCLLGRLRTDTALAERLHTAVHAGRTR